MRHKRIYCAEFPPTRVPTAGKLEPLGEDSRSCEGQSIKAMEKKSITATEKKITSGIPLVTPAGGYRVEGAINGVPTSFLLDTGAAVTLLRRDTWANVTASHPQELKSWSTQ